MKPYVPRPYGEILTNFFIEVPRCMGWAFMGAGKTVCVETAVQAMREVGLTNRPALAMGPLRVARSTWSNEAAKWDHLEGFVVSPIVGTVAERVDAMLRPADLYTTNYENVPWLVAEYKKRGITWPFDVIIADEATRLKNCRASVQIHYKTGKKFLRVAGGERAGALARVAFLSPRFIQLTGTPAPNGVEDLWGCSWFIDQGQRLGRTHESFIQRWFRPKKSGYGSEPLAHAQDEIQTRLKDVVLALNAKDWFDLKDPIVNVIKVDLPPKARKHYKEMERELFTVLEGHEIEANNAASKTIKCLQICNGAMFVDPPETYEQAKGDRKWIPLHDAKLDALESVIEEAAGMPVLVAYHFKPDLARLKARFPQGRALKTKQDEDDFKAGLIPVLFAHPQSAGHGIDGFQYATNIVCFFGNWWDAELRQQFIERIGAVRQMQAGLDRNVFVHYIVARDTLDEDVVERADGKISVEEILREAMKRTRA